VDSLGAFVDVAGFISFEEVGEEEMKVLRRDFDLVTGSSSSSDVEGEEGRTLRFRRFAGGTIPAEVGVNDATSVCVHVENCLSTC
jgi:hypothetical protein